MRKPDQVLIGVMSVLGQPGHSFTAAIFKIIRFVHMKGFILAVVVLLGVSLSWGMAWAETPGSGTWSGYYLYSPALDPGTIRQTMDLTFAEDGTVSGQGKDDEVGGFTIQGSYSPVSGNITFAKAYPDHTVMYFGKMSSHKISGTWALKTCKRDGTFSLEGPISTYKPNPSPKPSDSVSQEEQAIPWQAPKMIEYNKVLPPTPPESEGLLK